MRSVRIITSSLLTGVGPLRVAQPLPVHALRNLDPFILLHHAGPQKFDPEGDIQRIDPHPHRGFEPVTFVYRGSVHHKDSLGNSGVINAGGVQWITSGAGIIHSEGPTAELQRAGGEIELIQLWVNLPARDKMCAPSYQELHTGQFPLVDACNGALKLHVVSGELLGVHGPASTHTPVVTAMGTFTGGLSAELLTPSLETFALYVLNGSLSVNDEHRVQRHQLVAFNNDGAYVKLQCEEPGELLLLAGEPIAEPIAQYGPFVMNTEEELHQAVFDFREGKMGSLLD
jgi:redox-sensitive bicupin YhaK (pirin superfamily)